MRELGRAAYAPLRDSLPKYAELQTQLLLANLNDSRLDNEVGVYVRILGFRKHMPIIFNVGKTESIWYLEMMLFYLFFFYHGNCLLAMPFLSDFINLSFYYENTCSVIRVLVIILLFDKAQIFAINC